MKPRLSHMAAEAVTALGAMISAARRRRGWTIAVLAERIGVSVPTVRKIERGDPGVAIGTVFEAAWLLGVELFEGRQDLAGSVARTELALLPKRVRTRKAVDDDF